MYAIIGTIGGLVALLGLVFFWTKRSKQDGKTEAKAEYQDQIIVNAREANEARAKVIVDNEYRAHVRRMFDNIDK